MAITQSITAYGHLAGGEVYVRGTATLDNKYATGGETLNLSSYISGSTYPTVLCNGDDGYIAVHNRGTATAGTIKLYTNANANAVHAEAAVNTDASAVIVGFLAIGQAA